MATIKLSELENTLEHLIKAAQYSTKKTGRTFAILLNGQTGIGKTTIINNIAKKLNMEVVDVRIARETPENIGGIPKINSEYFEKILNKKFTIAFEKPVILFFDEFNRSNIWVRNAIMSLIFERELEGRKLHNESVVILAINTGPDFQVDELDPAIIERCAILNIKIDKFPDGMINYLKNNFEFSDLILMKQPEILKFIKKNDEITEIQCGTSLRRLEFASAIIDYIYLNNLSKEILFELLSTVLPSEIIPIIDESINIYDIIRKIITQPESIKLTKDEIYSIIGFLSSYPYQNSKEVKNAIKFLKSNLDKEFKDIFIIFTKQFKNLNKNLFDEMLINDSEFMKFCEKYILNDETE